MNQVFVVFTLLIVLTNLTGCHPDEHDHPELTTGKQLFDHHCSACHQQDGHGMFLKGYPPIHHSKLEPWQISHKIKGGENDERKMPSFKTMPQEEALLISTYLKSL